MAKISYNETLKNKKLDSFLDGSRAIYKKKCIVCGEFFLPNHNIRETCKKCSK